MEPLYLNGQIIWVHQQETLEDRGFPAYIDQWKQYYRVISGEYDMLDEAVAAQRRLKRAGFETLLIQ